MKSTTSANRIDAELNWSAIVCESTFSRSAIELGRMFRSRFSARACSARSAARAARRCLAKTASSVKTIVPPTAMLRASIVVVNQTGIGGGIGPRMTPAVPEPRKSTSQATNQRIAERTSLNTSAPSGARTPHSPTPPAPRKPPSGIIESVGASRMSSWFTRSSIGKSRVRENTAIAPARIAK